jgi:hypothetical protein
MIFPATWKRRGRIERKRKDCNDYLNKNIYMPAYSFKERFVPMVKDGSKSQTIRSFRRTPPSRGQFAHLYYGMRTKFCTKLVDPSPVIEWVKCIVITQDGKVRIYYTNFLHEEQRARAIDSKVVKHGTFGVAFKTLNKTEKDALAWADGFRHADMPYEAKGCFEIMFQWWNQTHSLPFCGNIIKWKEPMK